jgi:hypothetical protein
MSLFTCVPAQVMHHLLLQLMPVQQGIQDMILLHLLWVPLHHLAIVIMTPL